MVTSFFRLPRQMVVYLLQETMLFFVLTYLVLRSGTTIGLELNASYLFLIILIGGGWLAWRWIKKRPFPATGLDLALLVFLASYIIPTLFSRDMRLSAESIVRLLIYILVFYLVVDLVRAGLPGELITKVIILTSLPVIFFGFLQLFFWYSSWLSTAGGGQWLPPVIQRVGVFLGHPNTLAAYLNIILALCLYRFVIAKSKSARILIVLYIMLVLLILFSTASRGGWLATITVFATFLLLLGIENRQKILNWWQSSRLRLLWIGVTCFLIVAGLAVTFLFFSWQSRSRVSAGTGLDPSSRTYIWKVALEVFRDHPIIGGGPGTFGLDYLHAYSVPPSMLLETAHNYVFNTAAENGLIGIIGLAWVAIAIIFLFVHVWRKSSSPVRPLLLGIAAALLGLAVHSVFDWVAAHLVISLFVAILLGVVAASDENLSPRRTTRFAGSFLSMGWLVAALACGWSLWAAIPVHQGVLASNRLDWRSASSDLDLAARRDPLLAVNWFQAGFAHGEAALGADGTLADRQELDLALQDYRRGFTLEPLYAVNHANYGVLLWANGQKEAAISELSLASQSAPNQLGFALTWARMLEADGQTDKASDVYRSVLKKAPGWASSAFFRATSLRQNLVDHMKTAGQVSQSDDPGSMSLRQLQIARFSGNLDVVTASLAIGREYSAQGNADLAIQAYEQALAALEASNSYGVDQMGYSPYANNVFNQESIAADLLPGIDAILYTDDVAAGMEDLARIYKNTGESEKLAHIQAEILKASQDTVIPFQ